MARKSAGEVTPRTGISVGLNRGHKTKRLPVKPRHVSSKGASKPRNTLVRSVVRSVAGFAPYEKRLIEVLRHGNEGYARKFAKRRLGTHRRAKRKIDELSEQLVDTTAN